MKIYVVTVRTYYFGNVQYQRVVLAHNEDEAKRLVREEPSYRKDEDAEIESVVEDPDHTPHVII